MLYTLKDLSSAYGVSVKTLRRRLSDYWFLLAAGKKRVRILEESDIRFIETKLGHSGLLREIKGHEKKE